VLNPLILTIIAVDVSTEAESSPVQFIEMNMPQVMKYPPVIHHQSDTAFIPALRKSPKRSPRGKEENRDRKTVCREATGCFYPRPVDRIRLVRRPPEGERFTGFV
jgi:hypothetical protein